MKRTFVVLFMLAGGLALGGCATKKYVAQTTDPIKTKVDQVADQTAKQGATLEETRKQIEQDERELSATSETAKTADNRSSTALGKADALDKRVDQLGADLRQTIANLDDYKEVAEVTVNFKFDSDKLSKEAREHVDKLVAEHGGHKRYFITIEGFTDNTGSKEYNDELSRRRAYAVVEYLVAQHNVPLYRIHTVGLGKLKPAEEGSSRAARAKNRRVEVTIFSAESAAAAAQPGGQSGARQQQ